MPFRARARGGGFTLVELLIVVAIIGMIAAILIPNMLDSIQKSRQKRTMGDIKHCGTAMMAWLTDHGAAAAAGAAVVNVGDFNGTADLGEISQALVPDYTAHLAAIDAWTNPLVYRLQLAAPGQNKTMLILSTGRDGEIDNGGSYTPGTFGPTDYDQDLVWADGGFVRVPGPAS